MNFFFFLASIPHNKPLDDIDDPIYQMQRDAFTISRESLSEFQKIGKGACQHDILIYTHACIDDIL